MRDGEVVHGVEEARGHILDHGGGRHPGREGGAVDEGLHGGTHLALGLDGPVEFGAVEVVSAHHGPDLSVLGVDRHQSALHGGLLVQFQGHRQAVVRGLDFE